MQQFERNLGYSFKNKSLLINALTHSSYANENKREGYSSNERLEFLGDSVLGFVTASFLFNTVSQLPEGKMTKLRSELVCETALHNVAVKLDLGKYIRLGNGEEKTGGRQRVSILADAVEAVIAAIYLDGGFENAKEFIMNNILNDVESVVQESADWKTELQELIQKTSGQSLAYEELSESGPDHNKSFEFCVKLNGNVIGKGVGKTKKEAEQKAAKAGIEELSK